MIHNQEYKNIHSKDANFGNRTSIPKLIHQIIEKYNITSILDFGCGKGNLVNALKEKYPNIDIIGWDPAFNQENEFPVSIDMIITTDVLEHIDYDEIDNVLLKLKNTSTKIQYHLIACHKASKLLSNGRNAHVIVEAPDWWKDKLVKNGYSIADEAIESRISKQKSGTIAVVKYECVLE